MTTVNIASHLKEMAQRNPAQLAVLFPTSRDSQGRSIYSSLSYERLDEESDFVAAGLDSFGIGRGTKTVLMVPPSLEFFSLTFALFKAGATPVLVDPGMGIRNLGKCLAEAEPHAFIGVTKAHVARVLFGWGRRSIVKNVTVGRRMGWGGETLESIVRLGRSRQASLPEKRWSAAATQEDETAAILFTSGSTGVPKGAVYSHGNFAAQVAALKQAFGIEPGEIDLCTFPLFALFAPALGMTAVVPRMDFTKPASVNPNEIAEPIRQFGINNMFGSPALLNRVGREFSPPKSLLSTSQQCQDPLITTNVAVNNSTTQVTRESDLQNSSHTKFDVWSTVRRVLSAGAPVSPLILDRFSKLIPANSQIFTPYGATESLPVAVIGSKEILKETRYMTSEGAGTCVGRPVDAIEVAIIGITDEPITEWSDSLRVADGEIGEIVVHGPMVTQQYYNRPDLTALAKIHDPSTGRMRHRMGDVGYVDQLGRLWFCGRKSHRVITSDRTFFTEPVEGIFNSHQAVFRSALVGVMRSGIIEPVLCIERERVDSASTESDLSNEILKKELLELGSKFEKTRAIRTILFHRKFPVDIRHNSKIFREKLAVWATRKLR